MPKNRQRGAAKLDFLRPPKFFQNWVSHKKCPLGPIFKERYKCYTFSESSCQPLIGAEERKIWDSVTFQS